MSWDSKANNQWITVGDVSGKVGSGFVAVGSAPSGKSSSQYILSGILHLHVHLELCCMYYNVVKLIILNVNNWKQKKSII